MSNAGYDGWQNDYFDPEPPEDDGSMTSDELSAILREQLADVQHGIWSHWMRYLFSVCQRNEDGDQNVVRTDLDEHVHRHSRILRGCGGEAARCTIGRADGRADLHRRKRTTGAFSPAEPAARRL